MRLITKKQEREILKRIWANHIIAMAEIDDAKSLMHYLDNEAEVVYASLGTNGLIAMNDLIMEETNDDRQNSVGFVLWQSDVLL